MDCRRGGVIVFGERLLYEGLGSVKLDPRRTCQACGAVIPADSEFCPVCALHGALDERQETVELNVESAPSLSASRFDHYQLLTREDGTPF
jgi:predicted amidophosphoribosyltransferase